MAARQPIKKTAWRATLLTVFILLFLSVGAKAQVVLKPNGQNATPLRMKSVSVKAVVEAAQFATTDLDITFQNELNARVEADFLYTVPPGAVVTNFAYFYGEERVPARVAEKERAATIYQYITSRMRDPALVEMVGRNTFRARIFPVMPNADLRVQIRYVQALPANAKNVATYMLPLEMDSKTTLDALSVSVELPRLPRGATVSNNFGLPVASVNGAPQIQFTGRQYRVPKNLRVSVGLPTIAAPVSTSLIAARSGGSDGFFALAATPRQGFKLTPALLQIASVTTYDVETAPLGDGLLLCGRYKKSGTAQLRLSVPFSRTGDTLIFPDASVPNNVASQLWAAARIARLSRKSENRNAVVALSHRFTLPSKWTSWIAIPQEERERYKEEKNQADRDSIARQLTFLISQKRGQSRDAQQLRARFTRLCRPDEDPAQILEQLFKDEAERQKEAKRDRIVRQLANLIARKHGQSKEARRLRARFAELYRDYKNPSQTLQWYVRDAGRVEVEHAATNVAFILAQTGPNSAATQQARARLEDLCRDFGSDTKTALGNALYNENYRRTEQVVDLISYGKENTESGKKTWRELERVASANGNNAQIWIHNEIADRRLRSMATEWAQGLHGERMEWSWSSDYTNIRPDYRFAVPKLSPYASDVLRERIIRLARAVNVNPEPIFAEVEMPWTIQELYRARQQLIETRKRTPNDTPRIREQETRFLSLANRVGQEPEYSQNQIARIAARVQGELLDAQLASAPNVADVMAMRVQRALLKQQEEELRVRMGDPLVSVAAPANARTVVARMPDGQTLPLMWNAEAGRWQARFDVPTYASEGAYVVVVVIVLRDGTRQTQEFRYNVDVTLPQGAASVETMESAAGTLYQIQVNAAPDTVRVVACLPSGETILLTPRANNPGSFFARFVLPRNSPSTESLPVTFYLTDRAHNRATLTASPRSGEGVNQ